MRCPDTRSVQPGNTGVKDPVAEEDASIPARMTRLQADYTKKGMRTTVEGLVLVHEHEHPHILLLQVANSFYRLPGGELDPGEDEVEGLKKRLKEMMSAGTGDGEFDVGECVGLWYRPNFVH
jgi:cleavage and polyadenylation specificity factor subunit 5